MISIHTLLAESDWLHSHQRLCQHHFYPRSPCGERPLADCTKIYAFGDFYPRSPCGERQRVNGMPELSLYISIHALLAESDFCRFFWESPIKIFLSTLSLRRATPRSRPGRRPYSHFYPRSPCGERLPSLQRLLISSLFLSTLSLRRATVRYGDAGNIKTFLSTLSLRRATIEP